MTYFQFVVIEIIYVQLFNIHYTFVNMGLSVWIFHDRRVDGWNTADIRYLCDLFMLIQSNPVAISSYAMPFCGARRIPVNCYIQSQRPACVSYISSPIGPYGAFGAILTSGARHRRDDRPAASVRSTTPHSQTPSPPHFPERRLDLTRRAPFGDSGPTPASDRILMSAPNTNQAAMCVVHQFSDV